jgi:hypothetical protein
MGSRSPPKRLQGMGMVATSAIVWAPRPSTHQRALHSGSARRSSATDPSNTPPQFAQKNLSAAPRNRQPKISAATAASLANCLAAALIRLPGGGLKMTSPNRVLTWPYDTSRLWIGRYYDQGVVLAPLWLAYLGHDGRSSLPRAGLMPSRQFLVARDLGTTADAGNSASLPFLPPR